MSDQDEPEVQVHTSNGGGITHLDIVVPGQCPVMYCILSPHEGTQHVDVTGDSYEACEHGVLEHWDPCTTCGFGGEGYVRRS